MTKWMGAVVALVMAAATATPAVAQQGNRVMFEAGQYALTPAGRTWLDQSRDAILQVGEISITGHADAGEAEAAARMVAAQRAWTIAGLLTAGDAEAGLALNDRYFAPGGHQLTPEGGRLLDAALARRRQAGGWLVFVQPRYGPNPLDQRRADALAQALFSRGATWIKADGDDFAPGEVEASPALRAEADAFRRSVAQPAVVVQAFDANPAEGPAALTTLGLMRAGVVRDYLAAAGVPAGLMTVRSSGAADPAPTPEANRWAELAVAASGW